MRTVSACACARVQSRLSAAVAAAELLSSVRREIGMKILPSLYCFAGKYSKEAVESQHGAAACVLAKGLGRTLSFVMAGLVPAIHLFLRGVGKGVNARVKPGHDDR